MVSVGRVERGVALYLDREMMPKLDVDGLQGFGIGVVTTVLIKRMGNVINSLKNNNILQMLGVFDGKGNVDIDILQEAIKENISDNGRKMSFSILGSFTFYKSDVDILYNCIMEAGE